LKRGDIVEGFKYVRMSVGKTGHLIYLTERARALKTTLEKRTSRGKRGHPVNLLTTPMNTQYS
jgi:hypothetical protein